MSVLYIFFIQVCQPIPGSNEQLMQFGQSGGGRTQAEPDTLLDTAAKELSPSVGHMRELLTQNCC